MRLFYKENYILNYYNTNFYYLSNNKNKRIIRHH